MYTYRFMNVSLYERGFCIQLFLHLPTNYVTTRSNGLTYVELRKTEQTFTILTISIDAQFFSLEPINILWSIPIVNTMQSIPDGWGTVARMQNICLPLYYA